MTTADFELSLIPAATGVEAHIRFRPAHSNAPIELLPGPVPVTLDISRLRPLGAEPRAYGAELGRQLFHDTPLGEAIGKAKANTDALNASLRFRLRIASELAALHRLRWETLLLPDTEEPVATGQRIFFSRYIPSSDWQPVGHRPREYLRALVAVANPGDLNEYREDEGLLGESLAPLDTLGEFREAQRALAPLEAVSLSDSGIVSLSRLGEELKRGYDILYLVSHGVADRQSGYLLLECDQDPEAQKERTVADRVSAERFLDMLRPLLHRPRLIVLTGCQSAGAYGTVLSALGPKLAQLGIPAVVAMQGTVRIPTARTFIEHFFRILTRDAKVGSIDQAMAEARIAIAEESDRWMPVLYMRLEDGLLHWYEPGFSALRGRAPADWWRGIRANLQDRNRRCVPILGTGLLEPLIGSLGEVAAELAHLSGFPLAPHGAEDFPEVAQFIQTKSNRPDLFNDFAEVCGRRLRSRFGEEIDRRLRARWLELTAAQFAEQYGFYGSFLAKELLDDEVRFLARIESPKTPFDNLRWQLVDQVVEAFWEGWPDCISEGSGRVNWPSEERLHAQLRAAAEVLRVDGQDDVHVLLSRLPVRRYLTVNPASLLEDALRERQRLPVTEYCRWNAELQDSELHPQLCPTEFDPTIHTPLVYHLLGVLEQDYNVVLVRENFFDYLIEAGKYLAARFETTTRPGSPPPPFFLPGVTASLRTNALLFLGFRLEDWSFQILFRMILAQEGCSEDPDLSHIAVQVDPSESSFSNPAEAREYLLRLFGSAHVGIYWGSARDFLTQLTRSE